MTRDQELFEIAMHVTSKALLEEGRTVSAWCPDRRAAEQVQLKVRQLATQCGAFLLTEIDEPRNRPPSLTSFILTAKVESRS